MAFIRCQYTNDYLLTLNIMLEILSNEHNIMNNNVKKNNGFIDDNRQF